jgi:hypothetical protein
MSHNPNRGTGNNRRRNARRYDPHAGHRRAGPTTPQGVDFQDIRNREVTNRGWKIVHFQGEDFEMIYELISAGSSTGKIKHETADRSIRVLEGCLYVLLAGQSPIELLRHQSFSISRGTEYELCSNSTADVEVLFCQGSKYEEGAEVIEEAQTVNVEPMTELPKENEMLPRVDGTKAQVTAEAIKRERKARQQGRNPAPKKNPDGTPAGHGRTPLAGQQVTGANPRPIGPNGYAE